MVKDLRYRGVRVVIRGEKNKWAHISGITDVFYLFCIPSSPQGWVLSANQSSYTGRMNSPQIKNNTVAKTTNKTHNGVANKEGGNQNRAVNKKADNAMELLPNLIWTRQSKLWHRPIVYRHLFWHLAKGVSSMEKEDGTRSSSHAVTVTNPAAQQNTRSKSRCCLTSARKEAVLEE